MAEDIEQYISLAPKWGGGKTYRGITVDDETLATYKVGAELDINRGTASWSSLRNVAADFADNVVPKSKRQNKVIFVSPTQKNGVTIKHLSHYEFEHEVLVSKKSRYTVTKTYNDSGYTFVEVKEV